MRPIAASALCLFLSCLPAFGHEAQPLIVPDVVDGGGWQTTIAITNGEPAPGTVTLTFHSDTAGGGTQIWTPAFLETSSTTSLLIPGGSTIYLHTRGTAASLTQGWAQLDAEEGILAYVIFTNRVPGKQDQDATAPAVAATNRILVPFDNSTGFATRHRRSQHLRDRPNHCRYVPCDWRPDHSGQPTYCSRAGRHDFRAAAAVHGNCGKERTGGIL